VTQSEIVEIERRLGFALPESYRSTMLAYPFPPDSFGNECLLPNRPSDVVDLNEAGVTGPEQVGRAFFVGSDGGEESYFVDATKSDSPVYVFEIETGRHRVHCPSWEAYLQQIRDTDAEIAADREAARQRKLTKRWWEVWK